MSFSVKGGDGAMYHDSRSVYSEIHLPREYNNNIPRPTTKSSLQRAMCNDIDYKRTFIPQKDEKILSLMLSRGESDKSSWIDTYTHDVEWHNEHTARKERNERSNRHHREQISLKREEERQQMYIRKLEDEKRRIKIRAALSDDIYTRGCEAQSNRERRKADELQEFIVKSRKAKRHQENSWWTVNSIAVENKLKDVSSHEQKRANADQTREVQLESEVEKLSAENKHERLVFTEKFVEYERRASQNREAISIRLERRQHQAQVNHEREIKRKESAIKSAIQREEERRVFASQAQDDVLNESLEKANKYLTNSSHKSNKGLKIELRIIEKLQTKAQITTHMPLSVPTKALV